jgi:hypothetical protein
MSLATENLYFGAYALAEGASLVRVVVSSSNGRGRRTAVFELDGQGLEELSARYWSGTAEVNLARYREQLERLKDQLFGALRQSENETERRKNHDEHRQSRARGAEARR